MDTEQPIKVIDRSYLLTQLKNLKSDVLDDAYATAEQGKKADTALQATDIVNKVDKEEGKDLSTNDFTNDYKDRMDKLTDDYIMELVVQALELINANNNKVYAAQSSELLTNWKFNLLRTDSTGTFDTAVAATDYDASSWDSVVVPHDWSIHKDFNSSAQCGYEGGYLDGGDAWYRTTFTVSRDSSDCPIFLYFDGVYMESDVYVNGQKVGLNKFGYNPFYFDITNYIQDGENTLAVAVMNHQPSSRWYSGSGIFRNVAVITAKTASVALSGIDVVTPNISTQYSSNVDTVVYYTINSPKSQTVTLKAEILDGSGNVVGTNSSTFIANGTASSSITVQVNAPKLFGIYQPNLYYARLVVEDSNSKKYSKQVKFGYRWYSFTTEGFYLNGNKVFLRGVCQHHDLGCLGGISNKSGYERQIRILKSFGVNAIRITHNPASTEFLDACDEAGILVIEEFWDAFQAKETYDFARYLDTYLEPVVTYVVERDRNCPSLIMWSVGNEIARTSTSWTSAQCVSIVQRTKTAIRALDKEARPVTMGEDSPTSTLATAMADELDVLGINYNMSSYTTAFSSLSKPKWGSETTSAFETRGVYNTDSSAYTCTSYDTYSASWGCTHHAGLQNYTSFSNCAGFFVWTGFDYIGEPTPYYNSYPSRSSYFGIVDLCGFPKDSYYLYQSQWTTTPMVHILPHWDESDDLSSSSRTVNIYSNCPTVKLYLNNTLVSTLTSKTDLMFSTTVTYTQGTLVANAYNGAGTLVAQDVIYTSQGTATQFKMIPDKTTVNKDSTDLVFVEIDMLDANGVFVPTAANEITFSVEGGKILGADNGDPTDVSAPLSSNVRKAFSGKALCVVKPDTTEGDLILTATADGIVTNSVKITKGDETVLAEETTEEFIDAENATIYTYGGEVVACTGITLDKTEISINSAAAQQITATVTPSNTTNAIVWSSDNTSVAKVSKNGLVTPISSGTATIKATCGSYSATCTVTVDVSSISHTVTFNGTYCSIDNLTSTVMYGGTYTGTITADSGYTLQSVTVTMNGVDVTSSVLINNSALNIRNINGDIVITAIATNAVVCTALSIASTLSQIAVGYGSPLTVTVTPTSAASQLSFSSSSDSCAKVVQVNDEYRIMGLTAGTATITATCGSQTATADITVIEIPSGTEPSELNSSPSPLSDVEVDASGDAKVQLGTSDSATQFYITAGSYNGDTLISDDITITGTTLTLLGYYPKIWSTTTTASSVSFTYSGSTAGHRSITVNASGLEKKFPFDVGTLSCTGITLDRQTATVTSADDNVTLSVTVTPFDTTDDITWTSDNTSIKCVNGTIVALDNGTATITATCGSMTATCTVTVTGIVADTTLVAKNIVSDGSTKTTIYEGDWSTSKTLYVELTTDQIAGNTENIVSFGNNIGSWSGTHCHMYYPMSGSTTTIGCAAGSSSLSTTNNTITNDNNLLRIAYSKNGIYVNGTSMSSSNLSAFLSASLSTITVGSQEGATRYNGVYNEVRVFDTAYSTTELANITTNGYSAS